MVLPARRFLERFAPAAKVNFACHLAEGIFASFSMSIVGGVVMQLLLTELGYSMATLGFLTSVGLAASLLQFAMAPAVEPVRRKKRLVLILGVGQRVPLLLISLAAVFFGRTAPGVCLACIAIAQLLGGLTVSLLVAPWLDLVAETIPPQWTGRYFGLRNSISSALGIAAAGMNAAILYGLGFPGNFALLYGLAFATMAVSWLIFSQVDEMPPGAIRPRQEPARYYRELLLVLRDDANNRWFLIHQVLARLGGSVAGFYAMYAAQYHGVSPAFAAGAFMLAAQASSILGNLGFGAVADRLGHKRMLKLGVVLTAGGILTAACASGGYGFALAVFVSGLGGSCSSVSGMPFTMRLFPRGRRVGYTALSSLVLLPAGIVAAMGTAFMLEQLRAWAFVISGALVLAAILPLNRCQVPGTGPAPVRD